MIKSMNCPDHNKSFIYICIGWNCPGHMALCQDCCESHSQHQQKLVPINQFHNCLAYLIVDQNQRDAQIVEINQNVATVLKQKKWQFKIRSQKIVQAIGHCLIEQKAEILKKIRNQTQKQNENIVNYFNKMHSENLIQYRLLFSSQKGLKSYYEAYRKYCQIKQINCHLKQDIVPKSNQNSKVIQQKLKKVMLGSTTQNLMNLIKLKVSKKDAMKLSSIANINQSKSMKPYMPTPGRLPPPSPPKKPKKSQKTQINIK